MQQATSQLIEAMKGTHQKEREMLLLDIEDIKHRCSVQLKQIAELQLTVSQREEMLEQEKGKYTDMLDINRSLLQATRRTEAELHLLQKEHAIREDNVMSKDIAHAAKIEALEKRIRKMQLEVGSATPLSPTSNQQPHSTSTSLVENATYSNNDEIRRTVEKKYQSVIEKLQLENSSLISMVADLTAAREEAALQVESTRKALLHLLHSNNSDDSNKRIKPSLNLKQLVELLEREVTSLRLVKSSNSRGRRKSSYSISAAHLAGLVSRGAGIDSNNTNGLLNIDNSNTKQLSLFSSLDSNDISNNHTTGKRNFAGTVGNIIGTSSFSNNNNHTMISNVTKQLAYVPKISDNFFEGKGLHEGVPEYLRVTGLVPKWGLSKRAAEVIKI